MKDEKCYFSKEIWTTKKIENDVWQLAVFRTLISEALKNPQATVIKDEDLVEANNWAMQQTVKLAERNDILNNTTKELSN